MIILIICIVKNLLVHEIYLASIFLTNSVMWITDGLYKDDAALVFAQFNQTFFKRTERIECIRRNK